jgi:hypothetical protein
MAVGAKFGTRFQGGGNKMKKFYVEIGDNGYGFDQVRDATLKSSPRILVPDMGGAY